VNGTVHIITQVGARRKRRYVTVLAGARTTPSWNELWAEKASTSSRAPSSRRSVLFGFLYYTVSRKNKRHPFYVCDIFVRFHPILLIIGKGIPQEIWNKHMYTPNLYPLCVCAVPCKTSDGSERTPRRRPLPVRLVIEKNLATSLKDYSNLWHSNPYHKIHKLTFYLQNF